MRLIEKFRDARFQSALDLIWDLEQVATGLGAVAAPPVHAGDAARWWRPQLMPWIVAPLLTALALFLGAMLFRTAPREARGPELTLALLAGLPAVASERSERFGEGWGSKSVHLRKRSLRSQRRWTAFARRSHDSLAGQP